MKVSEWLSSLSPAQERERKMGEKFSTLFAGGEIHLWRAPGRVNLIGEHTDYNNLPVLPMAIPFDVFILFAPREDGRITLGNTSSDYELRSFMVAEAIPPYEAGDWGNYAKAAVQGIVSNQGWERRTWSPRLCGIESDSDGAPRARRAHG
jgi:galactokinase